jgi:tRNA threonylcarbamoyladenosine biosynthesis protein TsaB
MIVLGFDTATPSTAVGLRLGDATTLQARDDPLTRTPPIQRPGHATRLLEMAAELLEEAGLAWGALERIAVGVGPGRFTGLRVGIATAHGLAQSLALELVGVSSLWALALAAAGRERDDGILAVIDARRGEAFAAAYAPVAASWTERERALPRELIAPRALAPDDLGQILRDASSSSMTPGEPAPRWVAVGDGALLYRDELGSLGVRVPAEDSPLHAVSGEAICEIAVSATAEAIDTVLPDYRRRPDAEIALERASTPTPAPGAPAPGPDAPERLRA